MTTISLDDMRTFHRSTYVDDDGNTCVRYDYVLDNGESGVIEFIEDEH